MLLKDHASQAASSRSVSYINFSCGDVALTKVRGRRTTFGASHQADWSTVVSIGEVAKPRFQTNHGWRVKHATLRSPASVTEVCTGQPECLVLLEGLINWVISHRFPVSYMNLRSFFCQGLSVRSPKSVLYFCLGRWVVPSPQRKHGSLWITKEMEMEDKRNNSRGELGKFLLLRFFSRSLFSSFTKILMAQDR